MMVRAPEEIAQLGISAAQVLESNAVQVVFEDMRAVLMNELDSMRTDNEKEIMSIVRQLRAVRAVKARLDSLAQAGKRQLREEDVVADTTQ